MTKEESQVINPADVIVANLWGKQLLVGDEITKIDIVPTTRFGDLRSYTVTRSKESHDAETARVAQEKAKLKAEEVAYAAERAALKGLLEENR